MSRGTRAEPGSGGRSRNDRFWHERWARPGQKPPPWASRQRPDPVRGAAWLVLRTRGPARRSVAGASTHGAGRAASSVLTADPAGHLAVRKANGRSFLVPSAETLWEDARPPPGVLRDPHAAAARSRRGGREPSVCRVTARCHGESSGDPGAQAPKAPCAFGGGGGRGRSSRSLDVETPPGLTEGGELK